jgi:hypothetical protein
MTDDERELFSKLVQRILNYQASGCLLSPAEIFLLKAAEHIGVITRRNFSLGNEYQRLENGVGNLLKKAKKEAYLEGYSARSADTGYNNPYDETKVDGE